MQKCDPNNDEQTVIISSDDELLKYQAMSVFA